MKKHVGIQILMMVSFSISALAQEKPDDRIAAIMYYPSNVGRNIDEIIRILMALQMSEKDNILTPANWVPGEDVLLHAPESVEKSERLKAKNDPALKSYAWYFWFKKYNKEKEN